MSAIPTANPCPLWRASAVMIIVGIGLIFVPFANGLLAGILGGRLARERRRALVSVALSAIPLSIGAFALVTWAAPAVAPHWTAWTLVTLVLGALLGVAEGRASMTGAPPC